MILACADGGLLCVPALIAGVGALVAWLKLKPEPKEQVKAE